MKRSQALFALISSTYKFSGVKFESKKMGQFLKKLIDMVNDALGLDGKDGFNACLVNHYENGEKYISAHADDEKELKKAWKENGSWCCLHLGWCRAEVPYPSSMSLPRKVISFLIMAGKDFQRQCLHEIPKQKKIKKGPYFLYFPFALGRHVL